MDKEYYLRHRKKYHPANLKLVFILESPPVSGKYFYDEEGSTSEPLFSAMMKLLNFKPKDKREGLKAFADFGYLLIDATYEPVKKLKGKTRNNSILQNYMELVADLKALGDIKGVNIVLVKANICRLLEPRLSAEGFNIRNNGIIVPFPSTGQQKRFFVEIQKIIGVIPKKPNKAN